MSGPAEATAKSKLDPENVLERLARSGLRGRGGAWFPAARKWRAVRVEGGDPVVIGNGAEGEPGSIKDRWLMLTRPKEVLEGLLVAARTVGAREAICYLKDSFEAPARALEAALAQVEDDGIVLSVRRGDDGYVAGEETAILEALEGRRAWPRPKPPRPANVGLLGRPTLVQNVETLARVPAAIRDPEAYKSGETTLISLWGDVSRPGVYEVPLGIPLTDLVERFGEGAPDGIGMVFPAGPSAPPLSGEQAATPFDPEALRAAGSDLGTASVLVVGASRCPLAVASSLADFYEHEACGQCPPCTVGTASLARILRAVEAGTAHAKDLHDLAEAAGFMAQHGYCAHCRTAADGARAIVARFREEVRSHIERGRCPRPEGRSRPFDAGSPERRAVEALLEAWQQGTQPPPRWRSAW